MNLDPDLVILCGIVLAATALLWAIPASRQVFTAPSAAVRSRPEGGPAMRRSPVQLLAVAARPAAAVHDAVDAVVLAAGRATYDEPSRPLGVHMARVSTIVTASVDNAARAQRLHQAAREQVDSAHYALQNLLNELTSVMPISAPVTRHGKDVSRARLVLRPVYETALAA